MQSIAACASGVYVSFLVEGSWTTRRLFFYGATSGEKKIKTFQLLGEATKIKFSSDLNDTWGYCRVLVNDSEVLRHPQGEKGAIVGELGFGQYWVSNGQSLEVSLMSKTTLNDASASNKGDRRLSFRSNPNPSNALETEVSRMQQSLSNLLRENDDVNADGNQEPVWIGSKYVPVRTRSIAKSHRENVSGLTFQECGDGHFFVVTHVGNDFAASSATTARAREDQLCVGVRLVSINGETTRILSHNECVRKIWATTNLTLGFVPPDSMLPKATQDIQRGQELASLQRRCLLDHRLLDLANTPNYVATTISPQAQHHEEIKLRECIEDKSNVLKKNSLPNISSTAIQQDLALEEELARVSLEARQREQEEEDEIQKDVNKKHANDDDDASPAGRQDHTYKSPMWLHGPAQTKLHSRSLTEDINGDFQDGVFAVEMHESIDGCYVLNVNFRGKPTRHLIKPDDSGDLLVNSKRYGSFKTIELLIAALSSKDDLPHRWPVRLVLPVSRPVHPTQQTSSAAIASKLSVTSSRPTSIQPKPTAFVHVQIQKDNGSKVGLSIRNSGEGNFVDRMLPTGLAQQTNLIKVGMEIVSVNGTNVQPMSKQACIDLIKSCDTIDMMLKPKPPKPPKPPTATLPTSLTTGKSNELSHHLGQASSPVDPNVYSPRIAAKVQRVRVAKTAGGKIGLTLAQEHGFIDKVFGQGLAAATGKISPGMQILAIDNTSAMGLNKTEISTLIKSNTSDVLMIALLHPSSVQTGSARLCTACRKVMGVSEGEDGDAGVWKCWECWE
eukprot:m.139678 g.139678  ORF g.139678 m.139678 type:complete len:785 (+) comp30073_c0_seq2:959-3313(+)